MTVRNVRSYQTRGLIPPPTREGRRSIYSEQHLTQLKKIQDARARGASLSLIVAHLSAGGSLSGGSMDRSWLPVRPSTSGRPRGRRRARLSIDAALKRSEIPDKELTDLLDVLVTGGVLDRDGDQYLAERPLATHLNHEDGVLEVDSTLQLLAATVEAGQTIRNALSEADHGSDRRELIDLVNGTLNRIVSS